MVRMSSLVFGQVIAVVLYSSGAAFADCSAYPGGRVDDIANEDQGQSAGTCSVRGLSRGECEAVQGARHFKPDSGSGFTECFFDPTSNDGPAPSSSSDDEPALSAPSDDRSTFDEPESLPPPEAPVEKPPEPSLPPASIPDPSTPGLRPDGGFKMSDCDDEPRGSLFVTGPVQYSCRHSEFAHLNTRGQPRRWLFVGIACGRGQDDAFARHNAAARAKELVFKMQIDKGVELGGDPARNEVFITDRAEENCVRTR